MNTMEHPVIISTPSFVLKTLSVDDAQLLLNYYVNNKSHFEPWSALPDKNFYTLEFQKKKLEFDELTLNAQKALRLWIFKNGDDKNIIGDIGFTNMIRGPFQSCNVGYKTDVNYLRQGVMYEALSASFKYIFTNLKLHRIEANIIPSNIASINLIKKLGFIEEGHVRQYLNINGKWHDHIRFSLI